MEILRDKITELEFKLNLEGNTSQPEASLIAEFGSYKMHFSARIEEDTAKVSIPALNDILKKIPESASLKLEVMVDGAYFVPWQESATFKKSVSVGVSEAIVKNSNTTISPKVEVKLTEKPIVMKSHKFVEQKIDHSDVNEFIEALKR